MQKNKLILLSLTLMAVGCSKSKDYPNLLGHLEKKAATDDKVLHRELAAVGGEKCLKEVFSVSVLKAEVKELEKKFASGTKVTGKWKHLNLADLPIPQANFLKNYGNILGDLNNPDAFDYSDCKDVPCVINKIYGKPDYVAGYVHYLWYLKMGHLLGASNKVYDSKSQTKPGIYNGKNFAVKDYLYREKELFAYWRLMMMLKSPHTTLADLKEIYRVPQGESFDFEVEERRLLRIENERLKAEGKPTKPIPMGETCGLAYSNGYVIMQDMCLSLYEEDWEGGNFYDSVLHELSHQVDYHEGRKLKKTYRSQEKDYLDLSHFYLNEYVENGEAKRQWAHKPGIKLPSNYGGTSPAENYAETLALFRTEGTVNKTKISAEHWDFTSKTYYFGKNFEKKYLIDGWLDSQSGIISQLAFKAVSDCTKPASPSASTYFKKTDFIVPVQTATLNCLGAKASEISKEIRTKVRVSDPDGCQILTEYNVRTEWEPAVKESLIKVVNKYLKELQIDKAYFAKIQSFVDNIADRGMANEAYLACAEAETEESCYEAGVIRLALDKLAPLNLPEDHAQELAMLYLNGHALSDTKQYMNSYYRSFVQSHRSQIDEMAVEAWNRCATLPVNDDVPPTGKHFTIGDGYMVSSIYNCLNSEFPDTAKSVVRNLAVDNVKVQHPKEEALLYEEVVPELRNSLLSIYQKKKASEAKAAAEFIANDNGALRKVVLSDFNWVKDVLNVSNIKRDCEKLATSKIEFELKYQVRRETFISLIEAACAQIHDAPEYTKWLEESKSVFADKSVDGLENRILELARVKAGECLVQFPVDTNLTRIKFKKEREACLLGDWPGIESAAVKEFEADPIVIKFKVDVAAVKSQLETNRRRLQLKIIKEKF